MTTPKTTEYVLPHDTNETARLNLQHEAFVSSTGYLIHPRILSHLQSLPQVSLAEIATGTGIWLQDVSTQHQTPPPSTPWTLTGFDLSPSQFPSPSSTPPNTTFQTLDVRNPPPSTLHASFDAIHIRMLLGALTTSLWPAIARHVQQMLKPGGYIQWHEMDAAGIRAYPSVSGPVDISASTELLRLCVRGFQAVGRFMEEDMRLFPERVGAAGFEGVEVHCPSSDRVVGMRAQISLAMCRAVEGALRFLVEGGGGEEGLTVETVEVLARRARAEIESRNVYWRWDMYIITGRRGE